jgi:hypothetical protein
VSGRFTVNGFTTSTLAITGPSVPEGYYGLALATTVDDSARTSPLVVAVRGSGSATK